MNRPPRNMDSGARQRGLCGALLLAACLAGCGPDSPEPAAPRLTVDGYTFRDLNKNGRLDPYEDARRPVEERVEDLLGQMTLAEKAGLMFINGVVVSEDGSLEGPPPPGSFGASAPELIREKRMNSFNIWAAPSPVALATWYNNVQRLAEGTRLGIPVTIASDPRHAFEHNVLTSAAGQGFSRWPEPLGLAALGDTALVRRFADIARQEYLAVGIRLALHPMADLATEPRWPRINGTFGEDAHLAARMVAAYVKGFQDERLGPHSVATMTKHFPGGGPQREGLDPHWEFQKGQVYPGGRFDYHLIPFEAALAAGTAQIMPYYGVPVGQTSEDVAFAFNREIITGLLRERYGFDGVVTTDWGVLTDVQLGPFVWKARAWGVEHLTPAQRMRKALEAGVDQFGGESIPDTLVALVEAGLVSEDRIDVSARRILRDKFRLGLFDNPYVDVSRVPEVVGAPAFVAAGEAAQRRSIVLLKNGPAGGLPRLPLPRGRLKLYVRNLDPAVAARYGEVVDTPEAADVAILRLQTPWQAMEGPAFASTMHHGDLDFKEPEKTEILTLLRAVPTVVDIYLDRPAVIPEIAAESAALVANFGASDAAVLDVLFGEVAPEGRLPFELPSSMEAVRRQKEDVPYDSENPLFPFGFGLRYEQP
ncbi:glycoside hydrolase family 3 C-terminal domain-containing protein [Rhodocaloribacter litoris]|uniref:glycoside hydrolase family 3 protein n=1 Tax=Rhodocaloribacter litoris TaxID=2558931 RepID=UPI001E41719E|nr:glycoside hydrolase family 3 N-terminal domain-containing protein [Rhodocaloribacter litoris]QXD15383.1 glycoside hydrolase family 3 C-terminal domain-containing protein [Rhodocaloribacter litoris]